MGRAGGGQFAFLSGLATDDVAHIDLYLADGERWPVPLKDNVYAVQAPRDRFPVTLVAYDNQDRIISIAAAPNSPQAPPKQHPPQLPAP